MRSLILMFAVLLTAYADPVQAGSSDTEHIAAYMQKNHPGTPYKVVSKERDGTVEVCCVDGRVFTWMTAPIRAAGYAMAHAGMYTPYAVGWRRPPARPCIGCYGSLPPVTRQAVPQQRYAQPMAPPTRRDRQQPEIRYRENCRNGTCRLLIKGNVFTQPVGYSGRAGTAAYTTGSVNVLPVHRQKE